MSKTLEFYFDFGSPTTYLAHKRLLQLQDQYELDVHYRPILLGGLFKATGNASPVTVPAKGQYMLQSDLPRFCRRYGVVLNFNPHFPINTLNLMRGAIAAEQLGVAPHYNDVVFDAVWVHQENMGDPEVVMRVLEGSGLDASGLMQATQDSKIKEQLVSETEKAVERGAFGAPTMFIDDEMFFGQDRLDFVEEMLSPRA